MALLLIRLRPGHLQRAVRSLERPVLPPGHAPGQERLAAEFLKNTAERNNADPRLAPAQAIVEAAIKTARERGESARTVSTIAESTRHLIAERIKMGSSLDAEIGRSPDRIVSPAPPDKDRSR